MDDEIIPVCTKHSPYGEAEITPEELKNIPIVIRERGSGTLAVLSKKLESKQIKLGKLNIIARLGGTEALKNFLLKDIAVGFLSRLAVKTELDNGLLREVKIKSIKIERTFNFLMRKGEASTGIIKSFIKEAKSAV
jgi:DNA-binding transcriptional LysR family regulator